MATVHGVMKELSGHSLVTVTGHSLVTVIGHNLVTKQQRFFIEKCWNYDVFMNFSKYI